MSIWLRRKDKEGRMHYFSIGAPLVALIAIFGLLLALLLSLVHACVRSTRHEAGIEVSTPTDAGGAGDREQKETKVTKNAAQ